MSCSVTPTLTTRSGSSGTTVSPYLWATVAGKVPLSAASEVGRVGRSGRRVLVAAAAGDEEGGQQQGGDAAGRELASKALLVR